MKARFMLTGLAVVLAAVLIAPAMGAAKSVAPANTGGAEQVFVFYDFEKTVAPWAPMSDSPFHMYTLTQKSGSNGCSMASGSHYAQLVTLHKPTLRLPGSIAKYGSWMGANLTVAGTGARLVTVEWSARWSYNAVPRPTYDHPAVYVDLTAPKSGMQFIIPPKNDLTYSWQTFKYQTYIKIPGAATGTPVHIGIGWDNVGGAIDLDCVRISITYPHVSTTPTK